MAGQRRQACIERVQGDTSARAEREHVYRRLLETMHEAMAVERDGIAARERALRRIERRRGSRRSSSGASWPTSSIPTSRSCVAGIPAPACGRGTGAGAHRGRNARDATGAPHRLEFGFTRIDATKASRPCWSRPSRWSRVATCETERAQPRHRLGSARFAGRGRADDGRRRPHRLRQPRRRAADRQARRGDPRPHAAAR